MPVLTLSSSNVPAPLRGPILLSTSLFPRFWPTVYCDLPKADRKPSTLRRILGSLNKLYIYGETIIPAYDPDRLLTAMDIDGLKNLMVGFLAQLRSSHQGRSVGVDQTWRTVFDFIYTTLRMLGVSAKAAKSLQVDLRELKMPYGQLTPAVPARPRHFTAIPASVVEDMFDAFRLGGDRNPFRCAGNQERNLLVFETLIRLGLRRGELLALSVDALQAEFDPQIGRQRFWLKIAEDHNGEDPRFLRPSLKTDTSWRVIPVPEDLAARMKHYIHGFRGRPDHPFLFSSNQNRPLSAPAVSGIFATLTKRLSASSVRSLTLRGMDGVRPHDLRHTAVVSRLQLFRQSGKSLEESIERLRPLFGWAPGSKMPLHYGRAFFETQFSEIWAESLESNLVALRAFSGEQP